MRKMFLLVIIVTTISITCELSAKKEEAAAFLDTNLIPAVTTKIENVGRAVDGIIAACDALEKDYKDLKFKQLVNSIQDLLKLDKTVPVLTKE